METSATIDEMVREWAPRLEHTFDKIQSCSVVFEHPHNSQRHGQVFHVRIELRVPDRTIVVTRDPAVDLSHTDPRVAVADAFRAARRQLQDYVRVRRGEVKQHRAAS